MKKIILNLGIVLGLLTYSTNLSAYTAVTSGAWSNATTWGGIGPGSTVFNMDIVIPAGITVDMNVDVQFDGLLNSFSVGGSLISTNSEDLMMINGALNGSGSITVRKITMGSATATYSFTGPINADVFRNAGSVVSLTSQFTINDTLDLEGGVVGMASGSVLELMPYSNVRVNSGVLTNSGGTLLTGSPYDVWYVGSTKVSGEELNSASARDVHVMLNSNADNLMLGTNVLVNGNLDMVAGHVVLNGNRLELRGDLSSDPGAIFEAGGTSVLVVAGPGATLSSEFIFSSGSSLSDLIINRDTLYPVHLASDVTVTDTLQMVQGYLAIDSNQTLTIGINALIIMSDGIIMHDGTFNAPQAYDVIYNGGTRNTGVEINGTGLRNVSVNLNSQTAVLTQVQDVTVPGNFVLTNGNHKIYPSYALILEGDFHQTSNTSILGDMTSSLILSMATSVNDTLWMAISDPSLYDFVIDLPAGSVVTLVNNVSVHNSLNLLSGKVRLLDGHLTIGGAATIINASSSTYVITSGLGGLRMFNIGTSTYLEYPIGTENNYCSAAIAHNVPTQTGYIRMRVMEGIWSNGDSGIDETSTTACVNKTWIVVPDSVVPMNMDLKVRWETGNEQNMFDRQNAFIKGYWTSAWYPSMSGVAAPASWLNSWEIARTGIMNEGAFAVVDSTNLLSVPEAANSTPDVYPNPATDMVNVAIANPANDNMQYELYDAAGRLVNSFANSNSLNQIDLSNFERGSYTLRVTNTMTNAVVTRLIIKS